MYKLFAIFIGGIISIMLFCNGELSLRLGNYNAVVLIHIIGILVVGCVLIIKKQKLSFNKSIPMYLYTGGAIGVIMIIFNNLCMNSLGVSLTLSIGLLGQSLAASIIDHFGLLGMEIHKLKKRKIIGFSFVLLGIVIMTIY
ncbi:MAG: DMT family transporter [Clostridiaceae bacterium]|nr:DMT family transporter [Clostridiaceae bacterium]